jgi:hypothetical protein
VLCKTTSERPQSFAGPFVWKTMDDHYVWWKIYTSDFLNIFGRKYRKTNQIKQIFVIFKHFLIEQSPIGFVFG